MTTTTKTTDAAVAVYEITVGSGRVGFVRADNGAEAIHKFLRANYPTMSARSFQTYKSESGNAETSATLVLSSHNTCNVYATQISVLD